MSHRHRDHNASISTSNTANDDLARQTTDEIEVGYANALGNDMRRQHTGEIEIGIADALETHITRHVVPTKPVSQRKLDFEHRRPRIMRECMAEATGVFFYVLPGIASIATFTLNTSSSTPLGSTSFFSSIFQVGWAFAIGIAFAIITSASTSGGHFNPAITLCFAFWHGFPWKKVPHYIISQITGAFLAGLLLVLCYWPEIQAAKALDIKTEHSPGVFNGGVASIFCALPNPTQTNLGFLVLQEFFVDFYIGIVIWAALDPANPFVAPQSVPFVIGLAYATMIWGFGANTISTNLARDLGTRIVAAIFFGGGEMFTYLHYSWIAILVNVPATFAATAYYEFLMRDSLQKISKGHAKHEEGEGGLVRHLTRVGKDDVQSHLAEANMEDGLRSRSRGEKETMA